MSSSQSDDEWTQEQLMGMTAEELAETAPDPGKKDNKNKKPLKGKGVEENPLLWGLPGHLTKEESDTYFKFKAEIDKRDDDFKDTVFCFGKEEGIVWALCRWLRARKYVFDDVIKMVDEATNVRSTAKSQNFYPDPVDALGVDASLFYAMYPQLYSGFAKNGVPLFISKPGILNVDGMECITTLDGIIKFHWFIMMHDFANRLREQKQKDPENFKRFECVCVLDLNKLTTSQLSKRALDIIKEQAAIDSVCFPETMNKMLIINAPAFFAVSWRLIKGWLDPRTANKIEVISKKEKGEKRLLELVDAEQLPSDYGGKGEDTNITIMKGLKADRMFTKMIYLRATATETATIEAGESLEISVFTRSIVGAKFSVTKDNDSTTLLQNVDVKHTGTEDVTESPTCIQITNQDQPIIGPAEIKVKADSNAGRKSQNYLVVFTFKK